MTLPSGRQSAKMFGTIGFKNYQKSSEHNLLTELDPDSRKGRSTNAKSSVPDLLKLGFQKRHSRGEHHTVGGASHR